MDGRLLLATTSALVALTATTAHAAPGVTEFTAGGQTLTATTALKGSVSFQTPEGWHRFNGGDGCVMRVSVSVRGVATRQSAAEQVRHAVGDASSGQGARPGGRWGTAGPVLSGGEGEPSGAGLYGIAPIQVQARRFGQVRVQASLQGCAPTTPGGQALLSPTGVFVGQVNHLLAHAKSDLRVSRVRGQAPRLVGTPSARYSILKGRDGSRFVSLAVVFRLDRALDRAHLSLLAAPDLKPGANVPDRLFGGVTPGRIGRPAAHCYVAEPAQLKQRSTVGTGRWHVAINSSAAVVSNVRPILLRRAANDSWEQQAAQRLGC